jgi:hypothetical protein
VARVPMSPAAMTSPAAAVMILVVFIVAQLPGRCRYPQSGRPR